MPHPPHAFLPPAPGETAAPSAPPAPPGQVAIEVAPGRVQLIDFPLRAGTYEHLSPRERQEVALFVRLKSLRSADTRRRYVTELEKFVVWLKWAGHTAINEWVLMDYQEALIRPSLALQQAHPAVTFHPVSPDTADQYLNPVRSFIRHLHTKALLPYNVASQVPRLGVRDKAALDHSPRFTPAQWQAVRDTLEAMPAATPGQRNRGERLRFCTLFGYALGLRIKEFASHTHYHLVQTPEGEWVLKVVGKGRRARRLSLERVDRLALEALVRYRTFLKHPPYPHGEALPLLPALKPVVVKTKGPHMGTHINTKPLSPKTWEEQFKLFLQRDVMAYLYPNNPRLQAEVYAAEWAHLTPHSLRHTRITHLVEMGKDLLWVQKFAGHEKLDTTRTYFHGDL